MSKKRVIQYSKTLRHVIWQDGITIHSRLQTRRLSWLSSWRIIYGYIIDFQLRKDFVQPPHPARQFIHINPSQVDWFSYFEGHGTIEFWDRSTFNLDIRLKEISDKYLDALARQIISEAIAQKQIADL